MGNVCETQDESCFLPGCAPEKSNLANKTRNSLKKTSKYLNGCIMLKVKKLKIDP